MPKIPTFKSRERITGEVSSVTSDISVSPFRTTGAAIASVARAAEDYYIKERSIKEKTEATKAFLELSSELDTIQEGVSNQFDIEEANNVFQNQSQFLLKEKLSKAKNKRVKNLIQSQFDLDQIERKIKIKQDVRSRLDEEFEYNNKVKKEQNFSRYKIAKTPNEKRIIKEGLLSDEENNGMSLGDSSITIQKNKDIIRRDLLLVDMQQFAGKINGASEIKNLDDSLNGSKFLNDQDFSTGVYNAYNSKISELTVKGDPNSDYDRAVELLDELKDFERSNGYKVKTGDISIKIDDLEQKVLTEEAQHINLIRKQGDNQKFNDFSNDSKVSLLKSITDQKSGLPATLQDRLMANELEAEYDQMINDYTDANPDADLESKKSFVRNLTNTLNNIYLDRKISKIKSRSFNRDTFDIVAEKNRVSEDAKLFVKGELDQLTIERYQKIAKANGYTTTITRDDKKQKIGDVGAFFNDYIPILKKQVKSTQVID